jgi:hypothetical protein
MTPQEIEGLLRLLADMARERMDIDAGAALIAAAGAVALKMTP